MNTEGFYKNNGDEILFAPNRVIAPLFSLTKETKDDFSYPQDGWYWFNSQREAYDFLIPPVTDLRVILAADFIAKFTSTQLVQIYRLGETDDNVAVLLVTLFTSPHVRLDADITKNGLAYLISVGVELDLNNF